MQAQPFPVLVQPLQQGAPFADQSFVGHLGALSRDGDQAGIGQPFEDRLNEGRLLGIGDQFSQRSPPAGVLGAFPQLGQAQKDIASDVLLLGCKLVESCFGCPGNRAMHPPCFGIPGQSQAAAAPALPGLEQGVREQWKCSRLVTDLTQQQIHQTWLKLPAAAAGGLFYRPAQLCSVHRPNVFLALGQHQA